MKKLTAVALALCLGVSGMALAGCGENGGNENEVYISGSTSVQPLMEKLAAAFEAKHEDIVITVDGGGSGKGITDAQDGLNDFGMSSRALKSSETGVKGVTMATDGIALIVNPECEIDDVTNDEVYHIYADGTAIGGVLTAAISRESGSGTRGAFDELVVNEAGDALVDLTGFADCVQTQNSTGNVMTQIATKGNTNLLGYISMGSVDDTVKVLKYNGVEATVENVVAGNYSLSRPFVIVVKEGAELSEAAQMFYDYIFSEEGQTIVEQNGYIKI